jgi:hypothetical protein
MSDKNVERNLRIWMQKADNEVLMELWNEYFKTVKIYFMSDIDEVLSCNTLEENYNLISNNEGSFGFSDDVFAYDYSNDLLKSSFSVYDLIDIDDENDFISIILNDKEKKYSKYPGIDEILKPSNIVENEEGMYYVTEKAKYSLYKVLTTTNKDSDMVMIMDDNDESGKVTYVNYFFGATSGKDYIEEMAGKFIKDYEKNMEG